MHLFTIIMNIRQAIYIILSLFVIFAVVSFSSCKSEKATCEANRHSKVNKMKKNRSNYGAKYNYKPKPVRKDYVIRNGR